MKKRIMKKTVAILMAAVMMFSMAACGKKDGGKGKNKENAKENTKEMVFEGADLPLEGVEGDINTFIVKNDKLYFNTSEWIEEGKGSAAKEEGVKEDDDTTEGDSTEEGSAEEGSTEEDSTEEGSAEEGSTEEDSEEQSDEEDKVAGGFAINRMYVANLDGSDVKEISLPKFNENQYMTSLMVEDDGSITFMISENDMNTQKMSYLIMKVDAEGKELVKEDITNTLKLSQDVYISKFLLDDKGRLIVVADQSVYVLDENYKLFCEVKSDSNYIEGAAKTKDGKILCAASGEDGAKAQVLDIDNKKWGESFDLGLQYFPSSDSLLDGVEYDFYYKDSSGIYGYDMAEKKGTKIMDYMASNLSSEGTYGIVPIGADQLLGTLWDAEGKSSLVLYKKVDSSTIADKTTIIFGGLWMDDSIKKAAIEFNKQSKEYNIEFKDYSDQEDALAKMNADILAGKVPDIIGLNSLPMEQYAAKGLLEDLTPYYEKEPDIKIGDLIPSVAEAMQIDGKYYYIAPSFGMSTLVGASKDVGTESGWTFEEMKKLLKEKGEGVRPFYMEGKSDMLYSFLGGSGLTDFVDWKTGECRFDSQDFKDILEICNTGKDGETVYDEDAPSQPSLIKDGKVLFAEGWIDMESVQLYKKMYNGDITFIGYPNEDKQGTYFNFDMQVGIYAKSEVKEGAWEFLRSLMTKEYQSKNGNIYNNPTRQDSFDMLVKSKTATEPYTDELGQEVTPVESSWGWDDLNVEIKPLSKEEKDLFINLVNSTKRCGGYNEAMMEIVQEEAKVYFAGEKSLDETVDIIQNRIKTYVNENR